MEQNKEDKDTAGGAAAIAVATTTELLEHILLLLDMKTLLLAQRVNRKFQSVINKSANLQKKLFFVHTSTKEAVELCGDTHNGRSILFMSNSYDGKCVLSALSLLNPLVAMEIENPYPNINLEGLNYRTGSKGDLIHGSWQRMQIAHGGQGLDLSVILYHPSGVPVMHDITARTLPGAQHELQRLLSLPHNAAITTKEVRLVVRGIRVESQYWKSECANATLILDMDF
ncbi:hypothetical protein LTR37_018691 [Vermiconidia calcicola]|uniref:Uncharacterized protein n=1 Tax=Vermiconidia calcicola TaxID=1690605 RepID=A0ACC3MG98_9PEZI|nr:hypothetical protein LTR37_018691 [Vermiconidia calcicola]